MKTLTQKSVRAECVPTDKNEKWHSIEYKSAKSRHKHNDGCEIISFVPMHKFAALRNAVRWIRENRGNSAVIRAHNCGNKKIVVIG